jgi:hypothetical protein
MSEEAIQDTGSQEVAAASEAPAGFLDSLPEDLRNEPSLRNFADPASLAKSYVHAQRMIGADKIPLPGKSATDDEWRSVYTKLGAPNEASAYEVSFNEAALSDSELNSFRESAFMAGLNTKQAQVMADFLEKTWSDARGNFEQQADDARYQGEQELRQEFGKAFEQKLERAQMAANNLLGGTQIFDEITLSDGRMLGDHPEIVRMFAALADQIGEDSLEGQTTEMIMTPDEASRQIAEMTRRDSPYWDKMHPEHESYVNQVLTLREYI